MYHILGFCRFLDNTDKTRRFDVIEEACEGCNLCQITCPVDNCIAMVRQQTGKTYLNWTQHQNSKGQEGNLSTEQT
ncbi:hypothetical protein [Endozoicomonas acroporae]|uniref:hypothetical protein n=1 Tax=Endozoicomonas acroporae TaxID=1701104 RepID=UPI003D792C00